MPRNLQSVGPNIWIKSHKFKSYGIPMLSRMIICRLPNNQLWIWSPIQIDQQLKTEIDSLGDVAYVVAPNRYHHLFLSSVREFFPNALFYCAPGLEIKRKDVRFDGTLNSEVLHPWSSSFDQINLKGSHSYNEVIFFHKESKTLIVTDLIFNMKKVKPIFGKLFFFFYGVLGRPASSILIKYILRNRSHTRDVVNIILQWKFEQVIMAHGEMINENAKDSFKQAVGWIL
ncbi:MAG: hypothetical protein JWQ35_1960 [Bacteriovoracaceae bacterium]|nr:hypothetical protein [Bacteriovoracaceae bacterium]